MRADNRYNPGDLIGTMPDGTPIYHRPLGTGFVIVVEGKPGTSKLAVGTNAYNSDPGDPAILPDLQIQVDRDLGDGSPSICDNMPPTIGGVPAVNPPRFDTNQTIANTINDLILETGEKLGTTQIVVTHDMESAYKIGSRIAMLYEGRIIAQGTPEEIQRSGDPVVRQFIIGDTQGPILEAAGT